MALFLSTYINRVDKKGRVSVPATFRTAVVDQSFQGVVLFPSSHHGCLEGLDWAYMNELGARMDRFDLLSDEQDDLSTVIFAESVPLGFDGEGRIMLPQPLMDHAGIKGQAAFVGMGRKFQVWDPATFDRRRDTARAGVKEKGLTLPKAGADDAKGGGA